MSVLFLTLFVVLWLAGWVIAWRWRGWGGGVGSAVGKRRVSMIVPARNEEGNLPKLLDSVVGVDRRLYEVLVVDDHSEDATAAVAAGRGALVLRARPLPEGWRGKTWACHEGALAAGGDILVFVDADVWFEPGGLARLLDGFAGGALSVVPHHRVERAHENLSMFFNIAMAAGTVPDGLAGQVLVIGRDTYERVGGHAAVRGRVLENFRLADSLREAGVALRSVLGRNVAGFRMYPDGFAPMIEGWLKGFASGAGHTRGWVLGVVVAWMTGLMLPLLGFWLPGDEWWLLAYVACVAQVWRLASRVGSFNWVSIILYPLPLVFFFGLFAMSWFCSGRSVTWKGRAIRAD